MLESWYEPFVDSYFIFVYGFLHLKYLHPTIMCELIENIVMISYGKKKKNYQVVPDETYCVWRVAILQ